MGIYYLAVDWRYKTIINPPGSFANKSPGIYHPENPFPGMVIMKNIQGGRFEIIHDCGAEYETACTFKDITEDVYQEYMRVWGDEVFK